MTKKRINLALQGGGAHGAFTWGVLDRLLEEPDLDIAGISGTSAGALNGAALKAGLLKGGNQAARDNLDWLWSKVASGGSNGMMDWIQAAMPTRGLSKALELSPVYKFAESFSRMASPYDWGPFYNNPLREIVDEFDFEQVCAQTAPHLFVGATNVRSGKIKVFQGEDITTDAILASACLPTLFKALEIDGEAYWDGGYSGNPALFPLFGKDLPSDIVVININPLERLDVPRTAQDIQNRINEISFNSSLLRELRAIRFVQRLLEDGTMESSKMKNVFVHMIADDVLMNELSVATKVMALPSILDRLKSAGRAAGDTFLESHLGDIGHRSSVNLEAMFG